MYVVPMERAIKDDSNHSEYSNYQLTGFRNKATI